MSQPHARSDEPPIPHITPPFTATQVPVIKLEGSEAKESTTLATSSSPSIPNKPRNSSPGRSSQRPFSHLEYLQRKLLIASDETEISPVKREKRRANL